MAEPYRPQLDLNVAPQPGASAADFGASIGQGLIEGQSNIDNAVHTIKQRNRDLETSQAGVDFANSGLAADETSQQLRDQAAPGGAGHTQAVAEQFDQMTAEQLGKISDPHIRAEFAQRYAELRANVVGRENGWEAARRVDKLTGDFKDMRDTLATGVGSSGDPVGLQVSLNTAATVAHNLAVPADTQKALADDAQRTIAVAFANNKQTSNPKLLVGDPATGTKGLLDNPQFNQYLKPDDLDTLRSGAQVEIRRQDAEQRAAFDRAKAVASEAASALIDKVSKGYVPTAEEITSTAANAKTFGLDQKVFDLGVLQQQADVNRETRTWTPIQWHGAINDLEAKQAKGQTSEADNTRLKLLQGSADGAIQRFNSDPYAFEAQSGNPAPAVDWGNADPAALQHQVEQRVIWANAVQKSAGLDYSPYLNNDELKPLRDQAGQGPAGQIAVASQLRQQFGASIASQIVHEIDPSNADLKLMVGLDPRVAKLYREGVGALKDGLVKYGGPNGTNAKDDEQAMVDAFQPFKAAIAPEMQGAVLRAARNITAGVANEFNDAQPTGDDLTKAFMGAVQRAGGRSGVVGDFNAPGGFAEYNGRYAWLPPTMTSNQFLTRVSRADKPTWISAAGGEPYYMGPDGKLAKLSDSQIAHLKDYQLDIGTDPRGNYVPGFYTLLGPDGHHLVAKDGRTPWTVDIRQLGPR